MQVFGHTGVRIVTLGRADDRRESLAVGVSAVSWAISSDRSRLAIGSWAGSVHFFDRNAGTRPSVRLAGHADQVVLLAFSPD
jgi:WD40 repeat protein